MHMQLTLTLLNGRFAICQLRPDAVFPSWVKGSEVWSLTRTPDEMTVVCAEEVIPPGVDCNTGWRCFRLDGTFDLMLSGVLALITDPLATAGVSVFVLSSYGTDYVLVRSAQLSIATAALTTAGHTMLLPPVDTEEY
jgi:hypothetical protein